MMDERGWDALELAAITGMSAPTIYGLLAFRSNVSLETAARLAQAFGNSIEEWARWDALYRASLLEEDLSGISRLAKLYQIAPIREMLGPAFAFKNTFYVVGGDRQDRVQPPAMVRPALQQLLQLAMLDAPHIVFESLLHCGSLGLRH